MGETERLSPGHGGRANQTRRWMKALKSTFTALGDGLQRTRTERRIAGDALPDLRIGRMTTCGPTMEVIGAIRWPLRTGVRCRICPGTSESSSPRPKNARSTVYLRVPRRRAREVAARSSARTGTGGPGNGREPTVRRVRAPRTKLQIRAGMAQRGSLVRARPSRRNGCTARAALLVPKRLFPDRHGAEPGRPGRVVWRKPRDLPALDRSDARRTPVPARALASKGDETGRELRPRRGATPGPRMDASTWTVEGVPPARRSASSARRRGVSSALTSRGQALTAGR